MSVCSRLMPVLRKTGKNAASLSLFYQVPTYLTMRKIFLISLLALNSFPLLAQVKLGVKAGGMLTDIAIEGIGLGYSGDGAKTKLSYLAGAVLALPIHDRLSLQVELLYSNKGILADLPDASGLGNVSDNFHYLSLPLLLRYHLTNRLGIGVGPEVGYLLGAYQRSDAFGSNSRRRYYEPIDVAINLDLQYDLLKKLTLGLRYNMGIYDVTKRSEGVIAGGGLFVEDSDLYNRSLQLALTYWLK